MVSSVDCKKMQKTGAGKVNPAPVDDVIAN